MKYKLLNSWIKVILALLLSFSASAQEGKVYKKLREAAKNPLEVRHLELRKDDLSEIPAEIWTMANLEILDLGKNDLRTLPDSFHRLPNLRIIILDNNQFESFPTAICRAPALREIYLSDNPISEIPAQIAALQTLERLDLWHTNVRHLPVELQKCGQLKWMDLRQTFMSQQYFDEHYASWFPSVEVELTYGCDCNERSSE